MGSLHGGLVGILKSIRKKVFKNKVFKYLSNIVYKKILQIQYEQKYANIAQRLENNKELYQKYLIPDEPIFTFCMPTYNGQKYIARALESILMQETSYKYKIWVIDDCSNDNTINIVREYDKKYPGVFEIFVNPVNEKGLTVAPRIYNNVKTKYWMNFDQDDYWLSKDKLERSINYFENHPECTIVSSNLLIKSSNKLTPSYCGEKDNFTFDFFDYPIPLSILMQTSSTMYRNVFNEENLAHINSYVNTDKKHCVLGDTFRNAFALSYGNGYYENSVDSVYNLTENGAWSKLNAGQQEFYNLQYFYDSIEFFKEERFKIKMKEVAKFYLKNTQKHVKMLNKNELDEFEAIKKGLS